MLQLFNSFVAKIGSIKEQKTEGMAAVVAGSIPLFCMSLRAFAQRLRQEKRSNRKVLQLRASPCDCFVVPPLYETLRERNDSYSLIAK
ncbi:hypothetical protein A6770_34665 [Nostoc minutum NIES-26]|uniref:Uncharacterized protein n=1 Tax=Nostoc minutum NIES-26 TaxID=1844469 RepID=A0A367S599_9NOSO|nr:hypothetical protein A6770_34665 [Nostoc minutum NIES-26]